MQKLFEEAEQEEESVADIEEETGTDGQKDQPASQQLEVSGGASGIV